MANDTDSNRLGKKGSPEGLCPSGLPFFAWAIYRLIKQGKIKTAKNEAGFMFLDDAAIGDFKQLAAQKAKRKGIRELARRKGKSSEPIKK